MSDRGIPATLRHMHGFGSHTFKWVNAEGAAVWVKYHFKTEQGVKNLDVKLAAQLAGENPDYHTEDLFNAIDTGDFPAWRLHVQIMPVEDADTYRFDPFDVTKVWSQKDYPLIEVGRMVLDRNPENYFAEVEQATFSPGSFVPGIEASPDKMLQGRLFAYGDAHRYRVGANHNHLPINRPIAEVNNNQRDGAMNATNNGEAPSTTSPTAPAGQPSQRRIKRLLLKSPARRTACLMTMTITTLSRVTCTVCSVKRSVPGS